LDSGKVLEKIWNFLNGYVIIAMVLGTPDADLVMEWDRLIALAAEALVLAMVQEDNVRVA